MIYYKTNWTLVNFTTRDLNTYTHILQSIFPVRTRPLSVYKYFSLKITMAQVRPTWMQLHSVAATLISGLSISQDMPIRCWGNTSHVSAVTHVVSWFGRRRVIDRELISNGDVRCTMHVPRHAVGLLSLHSFTRPSLLLLLAVSSFSPVFNYLLYFNI